MTFKIHLVLVSSGQVELPLGKPNLAVTMQWLCTGCSKRSSQSGLGALHFLVWVGLCRSIDLATILDFVKTHPVPPFMCIKLAACNLPA